MYLFFFDGETDPAKGMYHDLPQSVSWQKCQRWAGKNYWTDQIAISYSDKQNGKHGEMGACMYLSSEFLEVSLIFHVSNDLEFSGAHALTSLQGAMRDV